MLPKLEPELDRDTRTAVFRVFQESLTNMARQLEILRLVALGQTNAEIARALFVSPRTVEMHVADVLVRLDCHTRTEAVRKAGELRTILP